MLEVCAAIIKQENKYLICQRAKEDSCPLQWEFPGGKKEACENLEECVVRELYEELELHIAVDDVYAKTYYKVNGRDVFFTFFLCSIVSGEMKLNVHEDVKWVESSEFRLFNFMEADLEVLSALTDSDLVSI